MPNLIEVMNEEYGRIDREAGRKKQIVGYVAGLVQKNYDRLVEVTGTDDGRALFDFVENALSDIEDESEIYGESEALKKVLEGAVLLGWIEIGESYHYCNIPEDLTDLGREIVEDYKRFKESVGMTE